MGRTKARGKKSVESRTYHENLKPAEGRQPNQSSKRNKRKREDFVADVEKRENDKQENETSTNENESLEEQPPKKAKPNDGSTLEASAKPDTESAPRTSKSTSAGPLSTENPPQIFGDIETTHDVSVMHVISASKIEKKVTSALQHLANFPAVPPTKPAVVMLYSRANVTAKMISVVEICKREITSGGGKWFQYNTLHQSVVERPRIEAKNSTTNKEKEDIVEGNESLDADGGNSSDSFETMKTPFERAIEGNLKIRAVPRMAIYLSRIRIELLRKKYGEQTNGLEIPE